MREQIIKKADEILKQKHALIVEDPAATYGPYETYYGYVTAEMSPDGVTFRLEVDESVRDQLIEEGAKGEAFLYDLLEDFTGNGWEWVSPEEVGALTDAPIIMEPEGSIYWYPNYQTQSPVEDLIESGETYFTRAE